MDTTLFNQIRDNVEDMELDAIWDYAIEAAPHYDDQCAFFFEVLEELLYTGVVQLISRHTNQPLIGSIEDKLHTLRSSFPKNSAVMNNGLWFFGNSCPTGVLWIAK